MEAHKTSAWRGHYRLTEGGREITTWDSSFWKSGGEFVLGGQRFRVRSNGWGSKYTMTDDAGAVVASAGKVGRKRWNVEAGGQTFDFQRKSFWSSEQELVLAGARVGSVRKQSAWRSDVDVDLPTLPPAVQVFVFGVVVSMWEQQSAAAAASSGGG